LLREEMVEIPISSPNQKKSRERKRRLSPRDRLCGKYSHNTLMCVYSQAAAVTSRWKRSDVTPNVGVVATALWAVFIDSTMSDMTGHRPVATAF